MYFDKISKDKNLLNLYNEIAIFENKNKGIAYHDYNHVMNVVNIISSILSKLGYDEEFIDEAKVAGILHDVGANIGKEGHPYRSYLFAKDYLKNNNIALKYEKDILEAIKNHSEGFDTDNIISLVLIFADKLDIKKSRISEEGKKVIGNRQYSHIEDIIIEINERVLEVNFITDGNIDKDEFSDYYFTKKVFKAIYSFSNKINLKAKVFLDGNEWNL